MLLAAALLFFALLVPAIVAARAKVRDERRIADLARVKRELEDVFNRAGSFPLVDADSPLSCAVSQRAPVPLGPSMKDGPLPTLPARDARGGVALYCPTAVGGTEEEPLVRGFILETTLERSLPPRAGFDEEEGRNYRFRVTRDGSWTLYRICGGDDSSCAGE